MCLMHPQLTHAQNLHFSATQSRGSSTQVHWGSTQATNCSDQVYFIGREMFKPSNIHIMHCKSPLAGVMQMYILVYEEYQPMPWLWSSAAIGGLAFSFTLVKYIVLCFIHSYSNNMYAAFSRKTDGVLCKSWLSCVYKIS